MSDDWNISESWVAEMRDRAWWHRRAIGCITSYWIYQHLGNLSPAALDEDEVYTAVRGNEAAEEVLFDWADRIESTAAGRPLELLPRPRRDAGDLRRLARGPGARRRAIGRWSTRRSGSGSSTRPTATSTTCWWRRRCRGSSPPASTGSRRGTRRSATGRTARRRRGSPRSCGGGSTSTTGARSRRSFRALRDLLGEVAAGRRGRKPASVVVMAGDVHHAYLCEVGWPRGEADGKAPIYQAVCSPYRNPLSSKEQMVIRAGFSRPFTQVAAALAKAAGAEDPGIRWAPPRRPLLRQPGRDPPSSTAAPRRCASTRRSPATATSRRWRRASSAGSPKGGARRPGIRRPSAARRSRGAGARGGRRRGRSSPPVRGRGGRR